MTIPDDDDTEIALDLLVDEPEPPEIVDPEPEMLMTSDEAEAYLDGRYAKWRELPPPPGVHMFGTTSFSKAELDQWLEKWSKHHNDEDDDVVVWL